MTPMTAQAGTRPGFGLITPAVQIVDTRAAPVPDHPGMRVRNRSTLALAKAALETLAGLGGMDCWALARFTEQTWTGLVLQLGEAARQPGSAFQGSMLSRCQVGLAVQVDMTLDYHLCVDERPVCIPDTSRTSDPVIRELGAGWGIAAFAGIALFDHDGERLGTLCGLSVQPTDHDVQWWSAMLVAQSAMLQTSFDADLAQLDDLRKGAVDRVGWSSDNAARLPDRRGWASLLIDEEQISSPLGDPVGLVLVDLGVVRTVRGLRKATGVVADAAPGGVVCRIGPRQLGILLGGRQNSVVGRLAHRVQTELERAGFGAATAHTMRAGLEPLTDTWSRVENTLVQARRDAALRRRR